MHMYTSTTNALQYCVSRNFSKSKILHFIPKIEHQILACCDFSYILDNVIINFIMIKWGVLFAIHNFSDLKSLANNAKIRSSLKFLLKQYVVNTDWVNKRYT